jgi:flagellar hook-basal body complex protein FliE
MAVDAVIGSLAGALTGGGTTGRAAAPGAPGAFGDALARLVETVETSSAEANRAVSAMMTEQGDVHDAMIALQQADLALQLTVQVRNKLVQAYQEIMRMPV